MIHPTFNGGTSKLTVKRIFSASRERVFRAWTKPEVFLQWFRPDGRRVILREFDVRVGGSFSLAIGDGSDTLIGTYLEVVRPEKLVFTWSSEATEHEETLVTIEFIAQGNATQLVLTHERFGNEHMHMVHQAGWLSLLAQLDQALSRE